jgi:murein DD-endopeptidase MepM/ murein hydrolase activator NlpD
VRSVAGLAVSSLLASPLPAITVTPEARSMQPGELVVLTISSTEPMTAVRARAFGRALSPYGVDPRSWRVLVGIDLTVGPGRYPVAIESGTGAAIERTTFELVVKARTFPTRKLTVDEAFVNPPPEAQVRIARETQELEAIWKAPGARRLWEGPFVAPVPDPANSAFGTRSILNGQPRSPHGGADFRSPEGRPVAAPNAGRVVLADAHYYTGNTVIIDHGLGLFSLFAHLSAIDVAAGDAVKTGQEIGKVGSTGRVTGPHLHWTVRANGARVDPLSLLSVLGKPPRP